MTVRVYVPASDGLLGPQLRPGAAIVASQPPNAEGWITVHYEDNEHGAENLDRFANRVAQAAERQQTDHPTSKREAVPVDGLIEVGEWDPSARKFRLHGQTDLSAWLGLPADDISTLDRELTFQTGPSIT